MPWYSPPSRREVSLIFFSLTTFILFYNLETSFSINGEESTAYRASNKASNSGSWRDDWEKEIYGDWSWEEAQVAKNSQKQHVDSEKPGATLKPAVAVSLQPQIFGTVGVNDGTVEWGNEIPTTALLRHVPGYTIMDNVFMLNGTLFIVTDDPSFLPLGSIASSGENSHAIPRPSDWKILSSAQARETLGPYGGLIHGVSWLVTDASPSNYTLFSLWRTYSSLNTSISSDPLTLPPPRRVFYPNVPTFMGEPPDLNGPIVFRHRSPSGFHPFLPKAAFPTLGLMYKEDWEDYALLHVPFLMRRVVVADEGAARRSRDDVPPFAVPLVQLEASKQWWEPIRRNVADFLDITEQEPRKSWLSKAKTVITYLARQDAPGGPKLRQADHEALVKALDNLGSRYIVNVISSEVPWKRRMSAIAQSTILIGVYGDHLADSVYMPPWSRSAVMEIFPPGTFIRDVEISLTSLDIRYFAWWQAQQHGVNALPPVVSPNEIEHDEVSIDASAIAQAIRRIA